jgi:Flp pilus assembly secretin CpaC
MEARSSFWMAAIAAICAFIPPEALSQSGGGSSESSASASQRRQTAADTRYLGPPSDSESSPAEALERGAAPAASNRRGLDRVTQREPSPLRSEQAVETLPPPNAAAGENRKANAALPAEPAKPAQTAKSAETARLAGPNDLISIDLEDIELKVVLEMFRRQTRLRAQASEAASTKKISVHLADVPALQALETIARTHGLWLTPEADENEYLVRTNAERTALPPNPQALEREINAAFPDSNVSLSVVAGKMVVRGQAKDAVEADLILGLIAASVAGPPNPEDASNGVNVNMTNLLSNNGGFDGELRRTLASFKGAQQAAVRDRIVNLLTIPGVQQVMLCVTVAEVNRSAGRSIGLNTRVSSSEGSVFQSVLGDFSKQVVDASPVPAGSDAIRAVLDAGQVTLAIQALRDMKLARTLAEPNLTALNGELAKFRAGGEFPVPQISGYTNAGLQGVGFVPFGVSLEFVPYILERDRIRLKVRAEVSGKDGQTNVGGGPSGDSAAGTVVPGLTTNNFDTTVELRSGQTLAVAGLIRTSFAVESRRIPFIGDIPIVGRLAAFDSTTSGELELVILVTPKLVSAVEGEDRPPLPGSDIFEPGDVAFFLHGQLEGRRSEDFRASVRTDFHRQRMYEKCQERYIIGPAGFSTAPAMLPLLPASAAAPGMPSPGAPPKSAARVKEPKS